MKKQFLEIGKIVSTHGVRGEVKVLPWCDSAEFLTEFEELYFDGGKTPVQIENARVHKGMAILKLEGVNTMDQANLYRGKVLYMDRDDVELAAGNLFYPGFNWSGRDRCGYRRRVWNALRCNSDRGK